MLFGMMRWAGDILMLMAGGGKSILGEFSRVISWCFWKQNVEEEGASAILRVGGNYLRHIYVHG